MIDDYTIAKILQVLPEKEIINIRRLNFLNNTNIALADFKSYDLNIDKIIRNYITIINDSNTTYFSQQFNTSKSLIKIIDVINPLLKKAEFEFTRFCEKKSFEMISHEVKRLILKDLAKQVFNMLYKVVIYEANVYAQEQNIKLNYETIDEYFQLLTTPDYKKYILLKYPLILKDADRIINNWKKNNFELLSRVNNDYEILKKSFSVKGKITHIDFAKGDSHLDGKTVCLLSFEENKIIYKPRNIKVEENFQTYLDYLNKLLKKEFFKAMTIVNKTNYGWSEYIDNIQTNNDKQIRDFYYKIGGYIAIIYSLNGIDFHYENLIAKSGNPYLIDLETLFQPVLFDNLLENDILNDSVMKTAMLPYEISVTSSISINPSSLFNLNKQKSILPSEFIEMDGEKLYIKNKRVNQNESNNLPTTKGFNLAEYKNIIINGFQEIYKLLLLNRINFEKNNIIDRIFSDSEIRILFRNTFVYSSLLKDVYHPNLMRKYDDRHNHFSRILEKKTTINIPPDILKSEICSLINHDIPIFCICFNSNEIIIDNNTNKEIISQSPKEAFSKKLLKLSNEDMKRQTWLIDASLSLFSNVLKKDDLPNSRVFNYAKKQLVPPANILEKAIEIEEKLISNASIGNNNIAWLGLSEKSHKAQMIMPLGIDLYNGISGILLFYITLFKVTKEKRYRKVINLIINSIMQELNSNIDRYEQPVGLFNGLSGVLYVFCAGEEFIEDKNILYQIYNFIKRTDISNIGYDVISGLSGCLIALLKFYQITDNKIEVHKTIVKIVDLILNDTDTDTGRFSGWYSAHNPYILAGFSHGVSGITNSLIEYFKVFSDERVLPTIIKAYEYEDTLFDHINNNWIDIRKSNTTNQEITAWCHGATGIGFSRLNYKTTFHRDDSISNKLDIAINTVLEKGFGLNHSLCHGDLGNLDFIFTCGEKLNKNELIHKSYGILNDIVENDIIWKSGSFNNIETYGLMTGLAGVGYQLLRFYDSSLVPSFLELNQ